MTQHSWLPILSLVVVLALALPGATAIAQSDTGPAPTPAAETMPPVSPDHVTIAAFEGVLKEIYERVSPSVVHIEVVQRGPAVLSLMPPTDPEVPDDNGAIPGLPGLPDDLELPPQFGTGSGFVWDMLGHIVTNNHVIEGAEEITVIFSDGTTFDGKVVGADPDSDLAVVLIDSPVEHLKPVTIGDSNSVEVGELVVAIGNPFGLESTMTAGIVSALGRMLPIETASATPLLGSFSIPDVIQTDAPINPGNSGGVLLDDQGEVIGVTSAIISPIRASAGVGFAIPSSTVQKVVPMLIDKGRYLHPWLGISGYTLTPDLAAAMGLQADLRGALVVDVMPGGPADEAELRGSDRQIELKGVDRRVGGDVITAADGEPIVKFDDLVTFLARKGEVGQTITLTLIRAGKEEQVEVKLQARPGETVETQIPAVIPRDAAWLGVVGVTLEQDVADAMRLPSGQEGVLVQQVEQDSPADKAGLRGSYKPVIIGEDRVLIGGDVIVEADGNAITSSDDLKAFVVGAAPGLEVTLRILRDGEPMDVAVTLEKYPSQR